METSSRPTSTYRWWLRLQLGLLLAGGATWLVGAAVEEDFVTGAGVGMLVGALVLRLGRRAAEDSPHRPSEAVPPGEDAPARDTPSAADPAAGEDGKAVP